MCGRYTLTIGLTTLQKRFGFKANDLPLSTRYNLAPGQEGPVVVHWKTTQIEMMRWGLIPNWAKKSSISYKIINARAETLNQKPSFRTSFITRRCLVLADGYYEWQKNSGIRRKIPLRFVLKDRKPFAFAGLWTTWKTPDDYLLSTFTIITTKATDWLQKIHPRTPVILQQKEETRWLDPNLRDIHELQSLLIAYPPDQIEAYEVSPLVNSPKNYGPECIEPVPSYSSLEPQTTNLFSQRRKDS